MMMVSFFLDKIARLPSVRKIPYFKPQIQVENRRREKLCERSHFQYGTSMENIFQTGELDKGFRPISKSLFGKSFYWDLASVWLRPT